MASMKIAVLGAGAWGTAIACHAARRHPTRLWARDAALVDEMRRTRRNERYLPGVDLPEAVETVADLARAVGGSDLLVIATSVAGLRPLLTQLVGLPKRAAEQAGTGHGTVGHGTTGHVTAGHVTTDRPERPVGALCWLCKGLEAGTGLLPHQVVAEVLGGDHGAALSGPSFAEEVARGLPVALASAAVDPRDSERLVKAFHHDAMRIYASRDVIGVEVGGAVKNVMAIATGISDGLGLGANARAALMTRGLAEVRRFAVAEGGQAETLFGLAGMGDLVLTCTGDLSRNRRVGLRLAEGVPLERILDELGHVAEGVACCRTVVDRAAALGVDMPISRAVHQVLEGRLTAPEAVRGLLARSPASEH